MLARTLLELDSSLRRDDVLFAYHGEISDALLTSLGAVIKELLQLDGVESRRVRNAFAVFIEQGQNILRYSADQMRAGETPMARGTLMIARDGDQLALAAGNAIAADAVARLTSRLDDLAGLDAEALKQAYKDRLRQPQEATSKGAGVGFMEMARRGTDGLKYEILETDDGTAYFAVSVTL